MRYWLCWLFLCMAPAVQVAAAPHIMVTLKPLHSLVSGVTEGVTEPELLVPADASLSTYSLKPLDAKKLREADVVFLAGRDVERFLERPLKANHKAKAVVVELMKADGLHLLPSSSGKGNAPYIWLDVDNASAIVGAVLQVLSRVDPAHKAEYEANAQAMQASLVQLDAELQALLAPYSEVAYLSSPDITHYLEKRYHLNAATAVAVPKKLDEAALNRLQQAATRHNAVCLFAPLPEDTLARIREVTDIGTASPEVMGEEENEGKDAYFSLMRALAHTLTTCFDQKRSLMS